MHQMFQRRGRVGALPRMYRRSLHDGAFRCDQPVKALARGKLAQLSGALTARADLRNGRERIFDKFEVHSRIERQQRLLIEFDRRLQYPLDIAGKNDSGIHEFAALDARYDAYYGIVIGVKSAHARPPAQIDPTSAAAA